MPPTPYTFSSRLEAATARLKPSEKTPYLVRYIESLKLADEAIPLINTKKDIAITLACCNLIQAAIKTDTRFIHEDGVVEELYYSFFQCDAKGTAMSAHITEEQPKLMSRV
jgi:hypothetical protein